MSITLHINGVAVTLDNVERKGSDIQFTLAGKSYRFLGQAGEDGTFSLDGETSPGQWQREDGACWQAGTSTARIQLGALEAKVSEKHIATSAAATSTALSPVAPMPGLVRKILVKKGAVVTEGQPLVVFEAMKLQLTLNAGGDGTVANVPVREGQLVSEGTELITLTAKKSR